MSDEFEKTNGHELRRPPPSRVDVASPQLILRDSLLALFPARYRLKIQRDFLAFFVVDVRLILDRYATATRARA